jgi:hypothetical protein
MKQGLGQLHAPPQTARQRFDQVARAVLHSELGQHLRGSLARRFAGQSVERRLIAEVFCNREFLVEAGGLESDPDGGPHRGGFGGERLPKDLDDARLGRDKCRKDAEESRLAAAVGPEKYERFALFDFQRQRIECEPFAVAVRKAKDAHGGAQCESPCGSACSG